MPTESIPAEVEGYLDLHHVITLSTASFTGMPHADTVVFGSDSRRLFFYAPERSTLARNIRDNRHVSFTVDDYTTDWRKVRELQGVGSCGPGDAADEALVSDVLSRKMGQRFARPAGTLHCISPIEMHFVDYDYDRLTAEALPQVRDRVFQFDGVGSQPTTGAVATALPQTTFEPGDVIFRPGDTTGGYFVVADGEVEVRAEGHGADQTVLRVRTGEMFGDRATLRGQRGRLTAHAITKVTLLAVARDSIRDLLLSDGNPIA